MGKKSLHAEMLGRRIARFRRDRGMTQDELAEELSITQPVVSNYENGRIRIPADTLEQLAKSLRVSPDELLGHTRPKRSPQYRKNQRFYRRLEKIDQLPKRDQDALLRTIEAFLAKQQLKKYTG